MLNPLDEQRPLAQVAILGLIYLGVKSAHDTMGSTAAAVIAVVALLMLPASVAVLGLERNILKAAYPVTLMKMIVGLGPMYVLVLAIIAGYALLIALLGKWEPWLPLQIAIYLFCILSVFSVLGGAPRVARALLDDFPTRLVHQGGAAPARPWCAIATQ